jgi:hypothetical protein
MGHRQEQRVIERGEFALPRSLPAAWRAREAQRELAAVPADDDMDDAVCGCVARARALSLSLSLSSAPDRIAVKAAAGTARSTRSLVPPAGAGGS